MEKMLRTVSEMTLPGPRIEHQDDNRLCSELLARVAESRDTLRASSSDSERLQRLAPASLALLKQHQLLNTRLMREMGGLEASITTQCKVLAALAEADSAAGWCSMVHNNGIGTLAAYFPDSALKAIFADGPPVACLVAGASGSAVRTAGGYTVSGMWRFCSGLHNAQWIVCVTRLDGDPERELLIVVPQADVTVHDTWNVSGLRGTGSVDFSLDNYEIAADRAIPNASRVQLRGERLYARPGILLAIYEHAAFAWGIGRRALRLLTEQAARLGPGLVAREIVAAELSKLTVQLDAAAGLMLDYYTRIEAMTAEESAELVVSAEGRAIAVHLTELAVACADAAFRRAGTRAAFLPNEIEMTLRDAKVAQAHILVSDAAYALHGAALANANASAAA
jgi:indole-3-acetate monooxygenase